MISTLRLEVKRESILRKKAYNHIRELKGNIRVIARIRPPVKNTRPHDISAKVHTFVILKHAFVLYSCMTSLRLIFWLMHLVQMQLIGLWVTYQSVTSLTLALVLKLLKSKFTLRQVC